MLLPRIYLRRMGQEGEEALENNTLFLFCRGEGEAHLSGSILRVHPCQVLLGYKGERVSFQPPLGEEFSYLSLCLACEDKRDSCQAIPLGERLFTLRNTELFWEVIREASYPEEGAKAFFQRAARLCEFLSCLFEERGGQEKENEKAYAQKAKDLIEAHFQEGIKITELAGKIGISRYYLATIFRREIGISPQEYLMQIRMERAASYLRETAEPIKSVAEHVGYTDSLAFSKAFRRRFGLSPSDYRRGEQ